MIQKIVYEATPEVLEEAIDKAMGKVLGDNLLSRYEGRRVDARAAMQILGISQATLYRYVESGILKPEDRTGQNYYFDLRYLLEFNIRAIKGNRFLNSKI